MLADTAIGDTLDLLGVVRFADELASPKLRRARRCFDLGFVVDVLVRMEKPVSPKTSPDAANNSPVRRLAASPTMAVITVAISSADSLKSSSVGGSAPRNATRRSAPSLAVVNCDV